jgi:hypothetical protein
VNTLVATQEKNAYYCYNRISSLLNSFMGALNMPGTLRNE